MISPHSSISYFGVPSAEHEKLYGMMIGQDSVNVANSLYFNCTISSRRAICSDHGRIIAELFWKMDEIHICVEEFPIDFAKCLYSDILLLIKMMSRGENGGRR